MKPLRRGPSPLFRRVAAAPTDRPQVRFTRGSANARWNPAGVFSSPAVNLLLLLIVIAAAVLLLFVGIPKLVEEKKVREPAGHWNMWNPPREK